MRGFGACSFIFAAAWGAAALPACGVDTSGLEIEDRPVHAGAGAAVEGGTAGDVLEGGSADSFLLDAVSLPDSDAMFVDVANDGAQEATVIDASHDFDAPTGAVNCDQDGDGWLATGGGCNGEDWPSPAAPATASTSRRRAA